MSTSREKGQGNSSLGKRGRDKRDLDGLDDSAKPKPTKTKTTHPVGTDNNVHCVGVPGIGPNAFAGRINKMVTSRPPESEKKLAPSTPAKHPSGSTSKSSAGSPEREGTGTVTRWTNGGAPMLEVKVDLDKDRGKYILEVTRVEGPTNEVDRAKQMAESAGTLLLQSEILRDMAEKLRAQYRQSLQFIFGNSALDY